MIITVVVVIVKKIKNRENYSNLNLITWLDKHYLDFDAFPSNLFYAYNFNRIILCFQLFLLMTRYKVHTHNLWEKLIFV